MDIQLITQPVEENEDPSFLVHVDGKPTNLVIQDARYYDQAVYAYLDHLDSTINPHLLAVASSRSFAGMRKHLKKIFENPIAGLKIDGKMVTTEATPHTEKNEGITMNTLTTEAKTWIKDKAKEHKINPVGKSIEKLLELVAEKLQEKPEVVSYMATHGGKIEEVPGFTGVAPKKNNRETSAGGKVQPEEPKKTPRKLNRTPKPEKPAKEPKKQPNADVVTLSSILEELGVEGRIARRKLRTSDIQKPGSSWEWSKGHADIAKVKELLKK